MTVREKVCNLCFKAKIFIPLRKTNRHSWQKRHELHNPKLFFNINILLLLLRIINYAYIMNTNKIT